MSKVGRLSPGTVYAAHISPCMEQDLQMIIEAERALDEYMMHKIALPPEATSSVAAEALLSVLQVSTNWPEFGKSHLTAHLESRQVQDLNHFRDRLKRDRLLVGLRLALLSGERDIALQLLNDLQNQVAAHEGEDSWELGDLSLDRMNKIRRILTGQQGTTLILPISAPQAPWLDTSIQYIECAGTRRFPGRALALDLPTEIDAYLAVGQSEYALHHYLATHWISSLGEGGFPDRLREIAEHAYGSSRAGAEFEAALNSLRVDHGPNGPRIEVNLFGQWLPIPVPVVWPEETDLESAGDAEAPEPVFTDFDINLDEIAESLRDYWDWQDINRAIGSFERRIGTCAPEFNMPAYQKTSDRIRKRHGARLPKGFVIRIDETCPRPEFSR